MILRTLRNILRVLRTDRNAFRSFLNAQKNVRSPFRTVLNGQRTVRNVLCIVRNGLNTIRNAVNVVASAFRTVRNGLATVLSPDPLLRSGALGSDLLSETGVSRPSYNHRNQPEDPMLESFRLLHVRLAILLLSWPGFAIAADTAEPKTAAPQLQPCKVEGVEGEARCGVHAVWEDREARRGRKIDLHVVVLPAVGPERAPAPIFYLPGGPGEGATAIAGELAGWTELRQRHDLVFVDQRGTGSSNPLACDLFANATAQEIADHLFPPDRIRQCREELEKRADLRLYTTSISADDLDEVRAWLGYEKINLLSGSYGTKLAHVYIRRHGGRVRSAVLDGVVPLDDPAPLLYARVGQRAVDLLLGECLADEACHQAFPRVREELTAVLERIDRGVTVRITDPRIQKEVEVRPNRGLVAEGIRYLLYSQAARQVPLWIHQAYEGDLAPLVTAALGRRVSIPDGIAVGLFLSVTCAEEVPFIDPAAVPRETAGTMLGDFRIREQQQACALWPRGQVPAQDRENVRSDVPVLLISGERDPVTPPEFGERVAAGLSRSLHVVRPRGNHGAGGACIEGLEAAFFERGSAAGLDLSCVREAKKPEFVTERGKEIS